MKAKKQKLFHCFGCKAEYKVNYIVDPKTKIGPSLICKKCGGMGYHRELKNLKS